MNQAVTFGVLFGGGILLTKALTGNSFSQIAKGHAGTVSTTGQTLASNGVAGVGTAIVSGATTGGSTPTASSTGGTVVGNVTYGDLEAIGKAKGWTGSQIQAWAAIVREESNGTITDTNTSSGAYGIAQMYAGIPGDIAANMAKYEEYGGNATTVMGQLTAMANYIEKTYGDPVAAQSYHLAHNSY
jgi:hypothetical protein